MSAPLSDLVVLDLTRLLPGAYCTWLLASLGAEVIKVEAPPVGDYQRDIPPSVNGVGIYYDMLNRGKRSVALDLKDPSAVRVFRRLVSARGDVIVESNRPGVMQRLGLGPEELTPLRLGLVYASLSGFGATGPLAAIAGHDINYLAEAGYLAAGEAPPPGVPWADVIGGGLVPALAITALAHAAKRSGVGAVLDAALFEAMALLPRAALVDAFVERRHALHPADPVTSAGAPGMPYYGTYRLADGEVAVGAVEEKFWRNLCQTLRLPGYIDLQHDADRAREVELGVAEVFGRMTRAEVERDFAGVDACVSVVRQPGEVFSSAGSTEREFIRADGNGLDALGSPFVVDGSRAFARGEAPSIGRDTKEVLATAGVSDNEISALLASGAAMQT